MTSSKLPRLLGTAALATLILALPAFAQDAAPAAEAAAETAAAPGPVPEQVAYILNSFLMLVGGFLVLVAGGEILVRGAGGLARFFGMSPLVVGLGEAAGASDGRPAR